MKKPTRHRWRFCGRAIRIIPVLVLLLAGCGRITNPFADRQVVAQVGDETLYLHDIESIFTPGIPAEDSVKMLQSYADQWVKKQLKVQAADKVLKENRDEIDRMVEDYRNALLTHKMDQFYVDTRIDTLFTDAQITAYYQENKADFVLGKSIVKAVVVKVPASFRQMAHLRELMQSSRPEDRQDVIDISMKNNFDIVELASWSDFTSLLQLFPTERDRNYDYLLAGNKVEEFKSGDYVWLVKVRDSRKVGDYAPQENVTDIIKRVIFNQRKLDIVRNYEDSLYREGVARKRVEVNIGSTE